MMYTGRCLFSPPPNAPLLRTISEVLDIRDEGLTLVPDLDPQDVRLQPEGELDGG